MCSRRIQALIYVLTSVWKTQSVVYNTWHVSMCKMPQSPKNIRLLHFIALALDIVFGADVIVVIEPR